MATCKDCVHYDICIFHHKGNENEQCLNFKNKVNVVSVVRCANCRHRKKGVFRAVDNLVYWKCKLHNDEILLTDYCSYGERSADNGKI